MVNYGDVRLYWVTPDLMTFVGNDREIPEMIIIRQNDEDMEEKNNDIYLSFARECKPLQLPVQYDVMVRPEGVTGVTRK